MVAQPLLLDELSPRFRRGISVTSCVKDKARTSVKKATDTAASGIICPSIPIH